MGRVFPLLLGWAISLSAAAALDEVWTARADMTLEGSVVAVDLDGDGTDEAVTAAYRALIAFNGDGTERWRVPAEGRYGTCPAVLERDGKGALVFAGHDGGRFSCFDGDGTEVWHADIGAVFCASPAVADLDGDGRHEVVQGTKAGELVALDAAAGDVRWSVTLDGWCSSVAAADLDGDGAIEVAVATGAGTLYVVDSEGVIRWRSETGNPTPDWALSSPIALQRSDGERCVVWATSAERIGCWDRSGSLVWDGPTHGAVASALSAGDFDGDGRTDIFAVSQLGVVQRFGEDGALLWEVDTQCRGLAPGALADIDGDGVLEFVLCAQQGALIVLNQQAQVVTMRQFENRMINVTATFGEFVPDRPGMECIVTGGESGRVYCLGTDGTERTGLVWAGYRGDQRQTAAWLAPGQDVAQAKITPVDLQWDKLVVGKPIVFHVTNPQPDDVPLLATADCLRPDGRRESAMARIVGAKSIVELPLVADAPGEYRFSWSLRDGAGTELDAGSRAVTVEPYGVDSLFRSQHRSHYQDMEKLRALAAERGPVAASIGESLESGGYAVQTVQVQVPQGRDRDHLAAYHEQLALANEYALRAMGQAAALYTALQWERPSSLVVYEGPLWENATRRHAVLPDMFPRIAIRRRCVQGEHESVSLKVLNLHNRDVDVRCNMSLSDAGIRVTLRKPRPVPTNQGEMAYDALETVNGGILPVPTGANRELWLDIDLSEAAPGLHRIDLTFAGAASATDATIELEVLPFEMAGFGAMRLCCWANYEGEAVSDLLAHGNNVFVTGLPPANPNGTPDTAALETFVQPLQGHDVFLLLSGVPNLGADLEEAEYTERLGPYLDSVFEVLAAAGIPADRVALYPHDEPGIHGAHAVDSFVAFGKAAQAVRPGIEIYTNGPADMPTLERLGEVTTIWSPFYYALDDQTPEMRYVRDSDQTLWSYDCSYLFARPIGPNTKTINIPATYRLAPLAALGTGATGIGYWCYNIGDPLWEAVEFEYPLVYTSVFGEIIPSRRWEAVREGMEDARILLALKERLGSTGLTTDARAAIDELVNETVPRFAKESLAHARLGLARYQIDYAHDDATVRAFREALLDCVALVVGE